MVGGRSQIREHCRQLIQRCLDNPPLPQGIEHRTPHGALPAQAARRFALGAEVVHDGLPGGFDQRRIVGGQLSFAQAESQQRFVGGFVAGRANTFRVLAVFGLEAFLFPGDGPLKVAGPLRLKSQNRWFMCRFRERKRHESDPVNERWGHWSSGRASTGDAAPSHFLTQSVVFDPSLDPTAAELQRLVKWLQRKDSDRSER